jgi:integrase/recombinase XerC
MDKRTVDLEGAAHVHVVPGATLLHPEETVFNAMVDGWSAQMRSRLLSVTASIEPRIRMVRRFSEFTNDYPWNWVPQDLEERTKSLPSGAKTIAHSTVRGYQNAVAMFSITSPTPLRLGGRSARAAFKPTPFRSATSATPSPTPTATRAVPTYARLQEEELQSFFDHVSGVKPISMVVQEPRHAMQPHRGFPRAGSTPERPEVGRAPL